MQSTAHAVAYEGHVAGAETRARRRRDILRFCLVALFVIVCYQFDWQGLRTAWAELFVATAKQLHLRPLRAGIDSFVFNGKYFKFGLACTAVDVFLGSIPLLWETNKALLRNLMTAVACFVCLSAGNLIRLELGFILYARGMSWFLAHEVMAGVFYFVVFLTIVRRRWELY